MDEKKGFLGFGRPPKKILKIDEINEQLQNLEANVNRYNSVISERFTNMSGSIDRIESLIKQMEETKSIPPEWLQIINRMKYINPSLPETKIIWDVLNTYKNLNQLTSKVQQEGVKQKLVEMKKEIVERKIHNCTKCGKALNEGEYYKLENQYYCMIHQDEVDNQVREEGL